MLRISEVDLTYYLIQSDCFNMPSWHGEVQRYRG